MTDDADRTGSNDGLAGKLKGILAKATQAVSGIVKKDDKGAGATGVKAEGKPTERSVKMKKAVEDARKAKDELTRPQPKTGRSAPSWADDAHHGKRPLRPPAVRDLQLRAT